MVFVQDHDDVGVRKPAVLELDHMKMCDGQPQNALLEVREELIELESKDPRGDVRTVLQLLQCGIERSDAQVSVCSRM